MATYYSNTHRTYRLQLIVNQTGQSVANNTSTISYDLRLYNNIGSRYTHFDGKVQSGYLNINGTRIWNSPESTSMYNVGYKLLASGTRTITHGSDGKKTVPLKAYYSSTSGGWGPVGLSIDTSLKLTDIPRVSEPSLDKSSVAYGSSIKITTNRKSTSFTHTIKYSNESATGTIATGVGDSYTYTVPTSHMSRIPSKTSSTYRLTIDTISGGSVVGTKTLSFTATVPTSYKPTVNTPTHADTNSTQYNKYKHYVQHHSKSKFTATYSARGYATITSVRFDLGGGKVAVTRSGGNISQTTASYTTPTLTFHTQGNSSSPTNSPVYLKVTVTDSRGRSTTSGNSAAMHIARYDVPRVDSFSAYRINTSGVRDPSGERIRVDWKVTIVGVGGNNNATYKWSYRSAEQTTAPSNQTFSLSRPSSPQSNGDYVLTGNSTKTGISSHLTWYVDFTVTDTVTGRAVTRSVEVPTGFVTQSFRAGGKGVAFGKEATRDGLDVAMTAYFDKGIAIPDTRNVISVPEDLPGRAISFEFKRSSSVGNPPVKASGEYSHIINVAGWNSGEGSGGWPTQISVGASGLAVRQATSATKWGAWKNVGGTSSLAWSAVTGKPAQATRWPSWGEVTSKPAQATRWPSWGEVTGKPSKYQQIWSGAITTGIANLSSAYTNFDFLIVTFSNGGTNRTSHIIPRDFISSATTGHTASTVLTLSNTYFKSHNFGFPSTTQLRLHNTNGSFDVSLYRVHGVNIV